MNPEISMLLVLVGAFFAPVVAKLLRMPVAVGELIYGLLIGTLLGKGIAESEILDFLSEFGFLLLMFLVGLEIDFSLLRGIPIKHLLLYTAYFMSVFLFSLPVAIYTGLNPGTGIVLGLISVGVLILSLKESGLLDSPKGKKILVLGVVGESVSLAMIILLHRLGEFHSFSLLLKDFGITLGFFMLVFLLFKALKLLLWWFPELIRLLSYGKDSSAMAIRTSLFLMFSLGVLAHASGIEAVAGAFLGGAIVSYFLKEKEELEHKLSAMGYGFLIPIFFIETGTKINISGFSIETLKLCLLILSVMLLVRYIPSLLLMPAGFSFSQTLIVPLLLSYPFTLMIAGIEILNRMGKLEEGTYLSLILSALLSTLLFPWLGKLTLRWI